MWGRYIMAIRKNMSFTNIEVVDWIEKNGGSKYITMLVLDDMANSREDKKYVTKKEIENIVTEIIEKYKDEIRNNTKPDNLVNNNIDKKITNSIEKLINF